MNLRSFLVVCVTVLYATSADAQLSAPHTHHYDHPFDLGQQQRNARADFFMAMLFLSQCRVHMAHTWLMYARRHDPANPEYVAAKAQFEEWRKDESRRTFLGAKNWRSTDLSEYYYAQRCDPENKEIAKEIAVILSDRNPKRERKLP